MRVCATSLLARLLREMRAGGKGGAKPSITFVEVKRLLLSDACAGSLRRPTPPHTPHTPAPAPGPRLRLRPPAPRPLHLYDLHPTTSHYHLPLSHLISSPTYRLYILCASPAAELQSCAWLVGDTGVFWGAGHSCLVSMVVGRMPFTSLRRSFHADRPLGLGQSLLPLTQSGDPTDLHGDTQTSL